jgi:hypothetical protein
VRWFRAKPGLTMASGRRRGPRVGRSASAHVANHFVEPPPRLSALRLLATRPRTSAHAALAAASADGALSPRGQKKSHHPPAACCSALPGDLEGICEWRHQTQTRSSANTKEAHNDERALYAENERILRVSTQRERALMLGPLAGSIDARRAAHRERTFARW